MMKSYTANRRSQVMASGREFFLHNLDNDRASNGEKTKLL